jgi:hypothetical protein
LISLNFEIVENRPAVVNWLGEIVESLTHIQDVETWFDFRNTRTGLGLAAVILFWTLWEARGDKAIHFRPLLARLLNPEQFYPAHQQEKALSYILNFCIKPFVRVSRSL